MGVYVKGMDIPKNCSECRLRSGIWCVVLRKDVQGWNRKGKHEDCPIVEVPEHGRLIDADKLPKYTGYALSANEVANAVANAPTVIAEE